MSAMYCRRIARSSGCSASAPPTCSVAPARSGTGRRPPYAAASSRAIGSLRARRMAAANRAAILQPSTPGSVSAPLIGGACAAGGGDGVRRRWRGRRGAPPPDRAGTSIVAVIDLAINLDGLVTGQEPIVQYPQRCPGAAVAAVMFSGEGSAIGPIGTIGPSGHFCGFQAEIIGPNIGPSISTACGACSPGTAAVWAGLSVGPIVGLFAIV